MQEKRDLDFQVQKSLKVAGHVERADNKANDTMFYWRIEYMSKKVMLSV